MQADKTQDGTQREQRAQRDCADTTRATIIDAAIKCFVKQGFAATSISHIATLADINQSLIYHHFGNKVQLWEQVKAFILRDYLTEIDSLFAANLPGEMFIEGYVGKVIHAYLKNPDIHRMLQWQRLEKHDADNMLDFDQETRRKWIDAIARLQEQEQLRTDLSAFELIVLLHGIVRGFLETYQALFQQSEDALHRCSRILSDMLKAGLTYQSLLMRRGSI